MIALLFYFLTNQQYKISHLKISWEISRFLKIFWILRWEMWPFALLDISSGWLFLSQNILINLWLEISCPNHQLGTLCSIKWKKVGSNSFRSRRRRRVQDLCFRHDLMWKAEKKKEKRGSMGSILLHCRIEWRDHFLQEK